MDINLALFSFFNQFAFRYPWLDTAIVFFAVHLGNVLILLSFVFLFFHNDRHLIESAKIRPVFRHRLKEVSLVFLSAGLAWTVTKLLKAIIATPRPFLALQDFNLLFRFGGYDSFPSGHATFFSALAVSLYRYHKGIGIAFGAGAVVISIARVAAGIHYPIDIAVGWVLGGVLSYGAYTILRRLADRYRDRFDRLMRLFEEGNEK